MLYILLMFFIFSNHLTEATYNALYGLSGKTLQLTLIDPLSGKQTLLGSNEPTYLVFPGLTAIDNENKIFYANVWDTDHNEVALIGKSLKDGMKLSYALLPFTQESLTGGQGLDVDPITGDVFVFGPTKANPDSHTILRVSPATGKVQVLGSIPGLSNLLRGGFVYDPGYHIFWLQLSTIYSINWYGFDVMNRRFVFNATDPYFLQCVNYDPVANAIYGLGFNEGNLSLISFSSQNSSMIVIANLPYWAEAQGVASAIDWRGSVLYAYIEDMDLVYTLSKIDTVTGGVIPTDTRCESGDCIISFEFLNKPI